MLSCKIGECFQREPELAHFFLDIDLWSQNWQKQKIRKLMGEEKFWKCTSSTGRISTDHPEEVRYDIFEDIVFYVVVVVDDGVDDDGKSTVVVFELHLKELVQRDAMVPAYLDCWSQSQPWPVTSGHLIMMMMSILMLFLFPAFFLQVCDLGESTLMVVL